MEDENVIQEDEIVESISDTVRVKTLMTVPEMRKLLGLKKTESYWLIHKNYFKTISINGQLRIDLKSFEEWYSMQDHYKKVTGEIPGEKLRESSYSIEDISKILGIHPTTALETMRSKGVPVNTDKHQYRVKREDFDQWFGNQTYYRDQTKREKDANVEENSITILEMAERLRISKNEARSILDSPKYRDAFEKHVYGRTIKITISSFELWYYSQNDYRVPKSYIKKNWIEKAAKKRQMSNRRVRKVISANPNFLTVEEAAVLSGMSIQMIHYYKRRGRFESIRIDRNNYRILKSSFDSWMAKKKKEEDSNYGINSAKK